MNERIIQQKRALHTVLIVLLLSVMGTMNAFALERGLPTVTTTAVTKSGNDVVSGGNVINDGNSLIGSDISFTFFNRVLEITTSRVDI